MESRLENSLRSIKLGNNTVECPKKFINDLACILIDNLTTEIDGAIQRFLLRSRPTSLTTSGIQIQTPRLTNDSSQSNSFIQYKLRSITDAIIFEPGFKAIRSRFFKICHRFRPLLSRSSSSDMRYMSGNSTANSDDTVLALSAFSFGYSLRSVANNDLNLDIKHVIDPNVSIKLRLHSLESLLNVSPLMLTRNNDLSLFFENLSCLLLEPQLFTDGMLFLSRLLQVKDECVWTKIIAQLTQLTESLLNSGEITQASKIQFVDFILQLIGNNSATYRHFSFDAQNEVINSFASILRFDSKFILYSVTINPMLTWLSPRLHSFNHRAILGPNLISIIENFEEFQESSQTQCFKFCLLNYCIKYEDLLSKLNIPTIVNAFKQSLTVVLKKKRFRRSSTALLNESSTTQTSATFYANHLFDTILSIKQPLSSKTCVNILKNSTTFNFTDYSSILIDFINNGLSMQNTTIFQLTIDMLDILITKNWQSSILGHLNEPKLIERLDPKFSPQHARLMLALQLTKNQKIWTHSYKYFVKSSWLNFIKYPIHFTTIDEKHTMSRLISKFLSFGEDRFEEENEENKWESVCLMWIIFTQPYLLKQLIDPINLSLLINEQFQKISQNQHADFFQRLSMLISNFDTLAVVRKNFHLQMKLSHILHTSSNHKLIIDKRLLALNDFFKQWTIVGPNECQKISELRLLINGSAYKRQLNMTDLKFPSIPVDLIDKPMEFLKQYLESEKQNDFSNFIHNFIKFFEKLNVCEKGEVLNETMPLLEQQDEWLTIILDYAFGLGLISSKRTTRSKLTTLNLPSTTNELSHWLFASLLLLTRFDIELTTRLINSILLSKDLDLIWPKNDSTAFFESIQHQILPIVDKLLNEPQFNLTLQRLQNANVPIFHLLCHFTYKNYLGLLDYPLLIDYFILHLIFGPKFQALFFVLVVEHLCAEHTNGPTIPLRHFFSPDLGNFSFAANALTLNGRFNEVFRDDEC